MGKVFNDVYFEGKVIGQEEIEDKKGKKLKCWRIGYTDGDEEDFTEDDMKCGRKLYLSVVQRNII